MCQEAECFLGTAVIDTDKDGTFTVRVLHLPKPRRVANVMEEPISRTLIGFSNQYRTIGNDVTTFSAFHGGLLKRTTLIITLELSTVIP